MSAINLSFMSPRKKESVISRSPFIDCLRGTSAIAAYATLFSDVTVSMVAHLLKVGVKKDALNFFNDDFKTVDSITLIF